jgi:hypothetical protein
MSQNCMLTRRTYFDKLIKRSRESKERKKVFDKSAKI